MCFSFFWGGGVVCFVFGCFVVLSVGCVVVLCALVFCFKCLFCLVFCFDYLWFYHLFLSFSFAFLLFWLCLLFCFQIMNKTLVSLQFWSFWCNVGSKDVFKPILFLFLLSCCVVCFFQKMKLECFVCLCVCVCVVFFFFNAQD